MMGREVELKLEVEGRCADRLRQHPLLAGVAGVEQQQLSVYFDTPRGKLRKAGYTLRVRRAGDGFIQTVKAASAGAVGLFDRAEWEAPVASLEPSRAAARDTPLAEILSPAAFERLVPVVRSEVTRTVWPLAAAGAKIELTYDQGVVRGGLGEQPIEELELELVGGDPTALMTLARQIGDSVPLRLGVLSKAERGFALADGSLARITKSPPVAVDPAMTVAEGFTAIALSCLKHFRLNEPLLMRQRLPAALHQSRVAMRRLRSALSLFRPVIRDDPDFARLRDELRWFTGQLGEARNLDVYLGRLDAAAPERARLLRAREDSYDRIVDVLASHRFRALILELVGWLLSGAWRLGPRAQRPLTGFANKRIDRLWRDIELRGALLARLDEEPRHRLRIDIKKIRYALEFTHALHRGAGGRQKGFVAALAMLQEELGHLNDMATAREINAGLGAEDEQPLPLFFDREERAYLAEAEAAFDRLVAIGAYWRTAAKPAGA